MHYDLFFIFGRLGLGHDFFHAPFLNTIFFCSFVLLSGVLQAAKDGRWAQFEKLLESQSQLSFEDFNTLPPGRAFGVVHQVRFD